MRKLVLFALLFISAIGANAQFEKNKWYVNSSLTGLNLSHSGAEGTRFGLEAKGGAFVVDNCALLLSLGGEYGKHVTDVTKLGVGGRYYFNKVGIFLGLGLNYKHYSYSGWKDNDFGLGIEAGYAFFINRSVTIEPAVYYDQSFSDHSDYSKIGLKIGFGFYF